MGVAVVPCMSDDRPSESLGIRQPFQWLEFAWLCLADPTFCATRNKRKAYFEYRLVKRYRHWRF